jgi:hypothetical protein
MAIKYNTRTGNSFFNMKAAQIRDLALKPQLKGIRCGKCGGDSEFTFEQHQAYAGSGSVDWHLNACCYDFEQKVYKILSVNRQSKFFK